MGTGFIIVLEFSFRSSLLYCTISKQKLSEMQYRNMTTVLTREYLDARPDGWLDYAPKRIAQL